MLKNLIVKNFAIIEDINIEFKNDMTVITGETGAGKSLIIDCISLLLGQRADADMIRYGCDRAYICGVFTYNSESIDNLLERYNILKSDYLTIERNILDNSKNIIKINNSNISLNILKQIAVKLADIHVQNDTYKLFDPNNYLEMINPIADKNYDKVFNEYTINYVKYLDALKKYKEVAKGKKEANDKIEKLEYEKQEIESLGLSIDLDINLRNEINLLKNFDKIYSSLTNAYENLENEYFSTDNIYSAANDLKKISDLDEVYANAYDKLIDSYYIIDEIKTSIYKNLSNLDFDQDELNDKIEKLNTIEKTCKKYNKTNNELINYLEEISFELNMISNYDQLLEDTKNELQKNYEVLVIKALELSKYRKMIAQNIEAGIIKECQDLDLEKTQFVINFNEVSLNDYLNSEVFSENGIDKVDFMINFNPGEPLKSLHKVASGGEMSRIMLAFKSYFANKMNYSLMVFDEIDTGVSGTTAKKIALKLKSIAQNTQVLCITHLPQVAAIGAQHIHIYKLVNDNRTTAHYKYLSFDERVEEIALMLSGDKMSMYALEHAKALLEDNDK